MGENELRWRVAHSSVGLPQRTQRPKGKQPGYWREPSHWAGEMDLCPGGDREMPGLCKWNKDMIRSALFERSFWSDIKGESEGADPRGWNTCGLNCPGEK